MDYRRPRIGHKFMPITIYNYNTQFSYLLPGLVPKISQRSEIHKSKISKEFFVAS